jgi:carbamate kinase
MTKEKAKKLDIKWDDLGKQLRRIDDAKQNYAPPAEKVSWFVMEDTKIANGERVGVPVAFDISEIAEHAEAVKAQDRMAAKLAQRINTAKIIVGATIEGVKPQTEIVEDYQTAMKVKRTAALDHIGLLPIGRENALSFTSNTEKSLYIWRNNVGTDRQRRYQIEWVDDRHWGRTS